MHAVQQLNKNHIYRRAAPRTRFIAAAIVLACAGSVAFFNLAASGHINLDRWLTPCGFQQSYGLPCPTCGFTAATLEFATGDIISAFYIQPAAALIWTLIFLMAFFALIICVSGVYFAFLDRLLCQLRLSRIILALVVIIVAGWAVTLTRALIAR